MPPKKAIFLLCLPLLLAEAYPSVSVWLFRLREPTFLSPLKDQGPWAIREDPYGSGLFGAKRTGGRTHRGLDLVAPIGSEVLAAKSGRAFRGRLKNGLGGYVEILHPDGWITRYGHLKKILVKDGQRVTQGQVIGQVGKSGNAGRRLIQPHLHFEVWNSQGNPVDPFSLIDRIDRQNPHGDR